MRCQEAWEQLRSKWGQEASIAESWHIRSMDRIASLLRQCLGDMDALIPPEVEESVNAATPQKELGMIEIRKSSVADTRTCDPKTVTKKALTAASARHINDVGKGLAFFAGKLTEAASIHDYDKLASMDWFHQDFTTDILRPGGWLENHYRIHRHHLDKVTGVPADVNLIDVLEHIVDCVMAGLARSGSVFPVQLNDSLLQQAVTNTVELLKSQVQVTD